MGLIRFGDYAILQIDGIRKTLEHKKKEQPELWTVTAAQHIKTGDCFRDYYITSAAEFQGFIMSLRLK